MEKKQSDIIILGLGPGDPELLTVKASRVLNDSQEVYSRTIDHPTIRGLSEEIRIHSFDHLYQEEISFSEVYERISSEIISLAKTSPGVVYAVPGDPFIAEDTPSLIISKAKESGLLVEVIPGVSFLEPAFSALDKDPLPLTSIVDAQLLRDLHFPPFPPDRPSMVVQIYSREIASDVKLTLMVIYPDDHPVILIHEAGTADQVLEDLHLYEIDRSKSLNNRSSLYLPPLGEGSSLESFQEIIAHLRAPDGCPWDKEQDHQSLRPNLLEECYEALEAIDADDPVAMQEELGDLLLQIVLHAQIASEFGEFTMSDVIQGIYTKIVKRHPHVFEDLDLDEADAVIQNWERIKAHERENNGEEDKGLLDGVPSALPSLTQADTYQKRAARVGFDWERMDDVLKKLPEEINELSQADDPEEKSSEMGDILFTLVNIARWMGVDAESALRTANSRFKVRFALVQKEARAEGRELSEMTLKELDQLWEKSKSELKD
jgi:tetrapyrrole methylase family protein/MazG family protein